MIASRDGEIGGTLNSAATVPAQSLRRAILGQALPMGSEKAAGPEEIGLCLGGSVLFMVAPRAEIEGIQKFQDLYHQHPSNEGVRDGCRMNESDPSRLRKDAIHCCPPPLLDRFLFADSPEK
jgi:hypothetical protein